MKQNREDIPFEYAPVSYTHLDVYKRQLLGYRIETMYDFFMVFVVMSATASLILFLLSKKLQKMMHGVE